MIENKLIPLLNVKNTQDSLEFYERVFGFKTNKIFYDNDKQENIMLASMSFEGTIIIMLATEDGLYSDSKSPSTLGIVSPSPMYIYCENIDQFYEKAIKEGAISLSEPHDAFWGDRVCKLLDLDGYEWMFALRGTSEQS